MDKLTKLADFLTQHLQGEHSIALNAMILDLTDAAKKIATAIDSGALHGNMGNIDAINVQGETQKALDVISDNLFVEAAQKSGYFAGLVSEELVDPVIIDKKYRKNGQYLLISDPLDGSSNVNVNISVGSIFSILHSDHLDPALADFLQTGVKQLCAGYAMYGTSTILMLTTGNGVNGFTLDREKNDFYLTHPSMQIPVDTQEFACNMSNYRFWQEPVQRYVDECLEGIEGDRKKDFNMRWVASMVAEIHRILVRGGVFMYPMNSKQKTGKLRLMYEASPMSFIVEQAGGAASTGHMRLLELTPTNIHQRVPVIMGSKNEVDRLWGYHQQKTKKR